MLSDSLLPAEPLRPSSTPVSQGVPASQRVGTYQVDSSASIRSSPNSHGASNKSFLPTASSDSSMGAGNSPNAGTGGGSGAARTVDALGGVQAEDGGSSDATIATANAAAHASMMRINGAIIVRCPAGDLGAVVGSGKTRSRLIAADTAILKPSRRQRCWHVRSKNRQARVPVKPGLVNCQSDPPRHGP